MPISRRKFLANSTAVLCGAFFSSGLQSCSIGGLLYTSRDIPIIESEPMLLLADEPLLRHIGGAVKKRFSTINGGNVILIVRTGEENFIALAAQCTHMGAEVNGPVDGIFLCPFHGSQYNAADGKVIHGPAEESLQRFDVVLDGSREKIQIVQTK